MSWHQLHFVRADADPEQDDFGIAYRRGFAPPPEVGGGDPDYCDEATVLPLRRSREEVS